MTVEVEQAALDIKRLKACINDLIGIVALPAVWSGSEPSRIVGTFLDVLLDVLRLDFVYVRLNDPVGDRPSEVRVATWRAAALAPESVEQALAQRLGDERQWPPLARKELGEVETSLAALHLGLQGEVGVILAGSQRADFPLQTERLLLNVAANQLVLGLQEGRRLSQQQRVAHELDQRVAQRTLELAAANAELKTEIAERRRVEAKLRDEERRLKRSESLLAEAQRLSCTASFSWRVATQEITWSEQAYRICEVDQSLPLTLELLKTRVHPEDSTPIAEIGRRARRDGNDLDCEFRLQMPDHSIKHLHLVARATRDQDGRLEYIGAVQDVTERRLSEAALGKARAELAHVARVTSLGALTASIAHEVNQPLSGIITNANTCLRMLGAVPPNLEGALETTRRTIRDGHRASEVIVRLRALFAKQPGPSESVDLNEATREVIALSLSELQRGRVILRPELAEDLPTVTGDRVQLQQVTLNLLLNAADAMSGVHGRPRPLIIRTAREGGDRVRLSVQDEGVGFETQVSEKLFEPFYTTKPSGMGIGLFVSRTIIENHQGRLWAAPNDGPGATFSFSIPCEPSRSASRSSR